MSDRSGRRRDPWYRRILCDLPQRSGTERVQQLRLALNELGLRYVTAIPSGDVGTPRMAALEAALSGTHGECSANRIIRHRHRQCVGGRSGILRSAGPTARSAYRRNLDRGTSRAVSRRAPVVVAAVVMLGLAGVAVGVALHGTSDRSLHHHRGGAGTAHRRHFHLADFGACVCHPGCRAHHHLDLSGPRSPGSGGLLGGTDHRCEPPDELAGCQAVVVRAPVTTIATSTPAVGLQPITSSRPDSPFPPCSPDHLFLHRDLPFPDHPLGVRHPPW